MDTDEAGEVSLEPEGHQLIRKKSCACLKNAILYSHARAV